MHLLSLRDWSTRHETASLPSAGKEAFLSKHRSAVDLRFNCWILFVSRHLAHHRTLRIAMSTFHQDGARLPERPIGKSRESIALGPRCSAHSPRASRATASRYGAGATCTRESLKAVPRMAGRRLESARRLDLAFKTIFALQITGLEWIQGHSSVFGVTYVRHQKNQKSREYGADQWMR